MNNINNINWAAVLGFCVLLFFAVSFVRTYKSFNDPSLYSVKEMSKKLSTMPLIRSESITGDICYQQTYYIVDNLVVIDGDTVKGDIRNKMFEGMESTRATSMRLAHIDAPESKQAWGTESTNMLKQMLKLQPNESKRKIQYVVTIKEIDHFGRAVVELFRAVVDGRGEYGKFVNMNKLMLIDGGAWCFDQYSNEEYKALEMLAKEKKRGIWSTNNPVEPVLWRKHQKDLK